MQNTHPCQGGQVPERVVLCKQGIHYPHKPSVNSSNSGSRYHSQPIRGYNPSHVITLRGRYSPDPKQICLVINQLQMLESLHAVSFLLLVEEHGNMLLLLKNPGTEFTRTRILRIIKPEEIFIVHRLDLVRKLQSLLIGQEVDDGVSLHDVPGVEHHGARLEERHCGKMPSKVELENL